MVNDLACTASEHKWLLNDLTFDQLETVLRDTYVIGGQAAFLKSFRTFKRSRDETPLEFYNRVDRTNFDIPASEMSTTQEIITRVGENFPEDFTEFCEHNDTFATLATYQLPKVVDGDSDSLASYRGAISAYKRLLDKAWSSHRVASQRVSAKVDSAIDAALRSYGIDARKRGLSTASHAAQLPDPKRSSSAPMYANANLGNTRYIPPLAPLPRTTNVNAVAPMRTAGRVWNNLQPHLEALNAFHGCYKCFMLNTSHGKLSCTYVLDQPLVPKYDLSNPTVMQIIQTDIINAGARDVPLARVEDIIANRLANQSAHATGRASAATGVNVVPLPHSRTTAMPTPDSAHISPNSSLDYDSSRNNVNVIHYTPADMASAYAGTGLPGRQVVANVRSGYYAPMAPPPLQRRDSFTYQDDGDSRQRVSAAFDRAGAWDYSDEEEDEDDTYRNQPAPRPASRSRAVSRGRDAVRPSTGQSRSHSREAGRRGFSRSGSRTRSTSRARSYAGAPRSALRSRSPRGRSPFRSPSPDQPRDRARVGVRSLETASAPAATLPRGRDDGPRSSSLSPAPSSS
ncbi:hypothetical protein HDZ31DRAFT_77516, partial [Schizophyllum fasciatum]